MATPRARVPITFAHPPIVITGRAAEELLQWFAAPPRGPILPPEGDFERPPAETCPYCKSLMHFLQPAPAPGVECPGRYCPTCRSTRPL